MYQLTAEFQKLSASGLYRGAPGDRHVRDWLGYRTLDGETEFILRISQVPEKDMPKHTDYRMNCCVLALHTPNESIELELCLNGENVTAIKWLKYTDSRPHVLTYEPEVVYSDDTKAGDLSRAEQLALKALREVSQHTPDTVQRNWQMHKGCFPGHRYGLEVEGNERTRTR